MASSDEDTRQEVLKFVTQLPIRNLDDTIEDLEEHLARLIEYKTKGYQYIQIYGPFYMIAREK